MGWRCLFELPRDEPPPAVHVVARWHWLDSHAVGTLRNPVRGTTPDGQIREYIALAPPSESPLSGAVMIIDLQIREPLGQDGDHLVLFTGGFEETLDDPEVESSFLLLAYPADDAGLRSADYLRPIVTDRTP